MRVKNKAKGDAKVPKEHRFPIKIVIEEQDDAEHLKFFDDRMNLG